MPVASAISTHPIQASPRVSHHPGAKGIGASGRGHGQGDAGESGLDFGEVLRAQAGVVSKPIGSVSGTPGTPGVKAKQVSGQNSGQNAGQAFAQANGEAEASADQTREGLTAAKTKSLLTRTQMASQGGESAAARADELPGAAVEAALKSAGAGAQGEGLDGSMPPLPQAGGGDLKATEVKDKSNGKAGREGKEDKIDGAQTSAEKLPQVPVQTACLAAPAAVAVLQPVPTALPKSTRVGGAATARGAFAPTAGKSASDKTGPKTAQGTAEGKTQGMAEGNVLPMREAASAPQNVQPETEGLTGDAADLSDVKSAGKQDLPAKAASADSGAAAPAKHQNLPVHPSVYPAQIAQAAVSGTGGVAAHVSTSPQIAGISGPAVGASHGAAVTAVSPYDRIDQGAAPVVLHSGAQQVAVGVHDPGLGWVEIKTQSAAGHVNATLVASSGQTHDSLAAQLPAISQFLEQRDVRVGTLAVQQQSAGSGANHLGNSSGGGGAGAQHSGSGYGGNGASGGSNGNGGSQHHSPRYNTPAVARHSGGVTGTSGEGGSPPRPLSYISVRA